VNLPRLIVLTDRTQLPSGRDLIGHLSRCVAGGLTHVVVRELDLSRAERADLAAKANAAGLTVIAAHESLAGCIGVHLPAGAEPTGGPWGRSCHTTADVAAAADAGASWATLSPFAVTPSKPGHGPPLADTDFAEHAVPVFALGGITPANARRARAAGAHGVAVMGAAMRADEPAAVIDAFLAAVQ
jgi:thiamine-phosphate pyrophosphorylase